MTISSIPGMKGRGVAGTVISVMRRRGDMNRRGEAGRVTSTRRKINMRGEARRVKRTRRNINMRGEAGRVLSLRRVVNRRGERIRMKECQLKRRGSRGGVDCRLS